MLSPVPVYGFVFAEFDVGDLLQPQQGVDGERDPPEWIDAVRATMYILKPMQNKTIRRY